MEIDLSKTGLSAIFKDYEVALLELFWNADGEPRDVEINTAQAYATLRKQNFDISRSSVINALNRFVDQEILGFREETCKGGVRRVYRQFITREKLWRMIAESVMKIVNTSAGKFLLKTTLGMT